MLHFLLHYYNTLYNIYCAHYQGIVHYDLSQVFFVQEEMYQITVWCIMNMKLIDNNSLKTHVNIFITPVQGGTALCSHVTISHVH